MPAKPKSRRAVTARRLRVMELVATIGEAAQELGDQIGRPTPQVLWALMQLAVRFESDWVNEGGKELAALVREVDDAR